MKTRGTKRASIVEEMDESEIKKPLRKLKPNKDDELYDDSEDDFDDESDLESSEEEKPKKRNTKRGSKKPQSKKEPAEVGGGKKTKARKMSIEPEKEEKGKSKPKKSGPSKESKKSQAADSNPGSRNASSTKKISNKNLLQQEEERTVKSNLLFMMTHLKDKNEKGISVNSLLKYMKSNKIQDANSKIVIDEEVSERMLLHLLKQIEKERKVPKDELVINDEELEAFVMKNKKFHTNLVHRIFK